MHAHWWKSRRALVTSLQIPVVVQERLDVALAAGAAGVHLGASSVPVIAVRPHVPPRFLVGGSVSAPDDLLRASGADFVTVGPVFGAPDAMGPAGFTRLARASGVPAIAIGGVDEATASRLHAAGAAGVGVIRAVLGAADPEMAAARLVAAFASGMGGAGNDETPDHVT